MSNDKQLLIHLLNEEGVSLDTVVIQGLDHLAKRLIKESQATNLTRIRNYESIVIRHFLDSLQPLIKGWRVRGTICCDVGTGAGFPGLVFALIEKKAKWVLIDSKIKKTNWLSVISKELKLNSIELMNDRAESLGQSHKYREIYDLCLSRSVSKGQVMLEYCLPLIKVGGELWAWQGSDFIPEIWEKALNALGGEIAEYKEYTLPKQSKSLRKYIVRILKSHCTPEKYPRHVGIPNKRPLY